MDKCWKATFWENRLRRWAVHALERSSVPRGFKFGGCTAIHPYNLQQQQQNTVQACHTCWPVTSKISGYTWPTKDETGRKTLGVNSISANVVRKDWSIYWDPGGWIHACLQLLEKSVMPEDRINRQHCIQLHNTRILLLNPDTWSVSPGKLLRYLLHEITQTGRTVWLQAHYSKL